jgi:ankyrin repeat protein
MLMKHRNHFFAFIIVIFLMVSACATKTPLIKAIEYGDSLAVQKLINQGADINESGGKGYTPLMYAIWSGKTENVKFLIDKGADINKRDKYGYTPLIWAARFVDYDIAKLLIDRGADINKRDEYGYTPLIWAAYFVDYDIAKLLIDRGADVNAKNKEGYSALLYAVGANCGDWAHADYCRTNADSGSVIAADIIKLLINNGADINNNNPEGGTLLGLALACRKWNFLDYLTRTRNINLWLPEEGKARLFFVGYDMPENATIIITNPIINGNQNVELCAKLPHSLAFIDVSPGNHSFHIPGNSQHEPNAVESTLGLLHFLVTIIDQSQRESSITEIEATEIEAIAGQTYYFRVTQKQRAFSSGAWTKIVPIEKAEGEYLIKRIVQQVRP